MLFAGPKWMPGWARRLQWLFLVGFGVWIGWMIFGDPFERTDITLSIFALLIIPAVVRAYFMMHAVARGEVSPFGKTHNHER